MVCLPTIPSLLMFILMMELQFCPVQHVAFAATCTQIPSFYPSWLKQGPLVLQRVSIVVFVLTIVVDGCICVSVYMIVNDDGLLCWIVIKSFGGDALYFGVVKNDCNG